MEKFVHGLSDRITNFHVLKKRDLRLYLGNRRTIAKNNAL